MNMADLSRAAVGAKCKHPDTYAAMFAAELYDVFVAATNVEYKDYRRIRAVASRWNMGVYKGIPDTKFRVMTHEKTVIFVRVE